jgi:hypothetical protein
LGLSNVFRALTPLVLLPVVLGCADGGLNYRERSTLTQSWYATIENFCDEEITADQVDGLVEEVADILHVKLDPKVPKVRVMVMPSSRISELYRQVTTVAPHGADARALYWPGANLVVVPYFSRMVLGHELAHYLTDQYLKSTPRRNWEHIAIMVEDALPDTPRLMARRFPAPDGLTARTVLVPFGNHNN